MSHEEKDMLSYDANYNLFLVKSMLSSIRNIQDRQTVVRWLRFLKTSANTIDEMRLRNDFMYCLVLNVQEGTLKPPFDKPPPNSSLVSMANLLPGTSEGTGFGARAEISRRSPDGGAFLTAQPMPDVGAFCYLAVVSKKKN